jgi:signal transduction histidine kinase
MEPFTGWPGDLGSKVFQDAGDAMLLVDRVVLDCNRSALSLFHARKAQLVGRSLQELYPPQQKDGYDSRVAAQQYAKRVAEGETLRYIWSFLRPDGTRFDAGVTLSRVGDAGSNLQLAILRELPGIQAVAETEELLAERTAQLVAVSAELDAFSYSITHDLCAAIRGIAACSQIVIDDYSASLGEEAKRWLLHIHDDSMRLDRFTEALLDLSRVSRVALHPANVNLTSIAREIGANLKSGSRDRTVKLEVQPGLAARGDVALIRTLLQNLLENAWKFTSKKTDARIEFGCLPSDALQNVFYVRDNGAGFDKAHADRLFVAFQRLHSEKDFPGNGVGLAIVRRIAHRHGGKVWAEGGTGVGATFFFTLGGRSA